MCLSVSSTCASDEISKSVSYRLFIDQILIVLVTSRKRSTWPWLTFVITNMVRLQGWK